MTFSEISKYQRWYKQLIADARLNKVITVYSEVHHILPRSCGGSDDPNNLVRLSYRQHFLAHWLLTKFYRGENLRKMQRALWAMTLTTRGERIIAGWQFEVAKRAIKDFAMSPTQIRNRIIAKRSAVIAREYARGQAIAEATGGKSLEQVTEEFLAGPYAAWKMGLKKLPPLSVSLKESEGNRGKRKRPRPSKRVRRRLRAARAEANASAS